MKKDFNSTIKEFILSGRCGGRITEEIAGEYGITNRQAGARMGKLTAKKLVFPYTKGTIVFSHGLHNKTGSPMGLSNTYYEWIGSDESQNE